MTTIKFVIGADHCPSLICRIAGFVAQRGLIPSSLIFKNRSHRCEIDLFIDDIEFQDAKILAAKFATIIPVRDVDLLVE